MIFIDFRMFWRGGGDQIEEEMDQDGNDNFISFRHRFWKDLQFIFDLKIMGV